MTMPNQITKAEAIDLLLETCPGAYPAWSEHRREYGDIPYVEISAFARHVIDLWEAGKTESYSAVFKLIERLIVEGDEEVRGLATVGFLESLQNNASRKDFGYGVFTESLGPRSLEAWSKLEKLWQGKRNLGDVVREKRK